MRTEARHLGREVGTRPGAHECQVDVPRATGDSEARVADKQDDFTWEVRDALNHLHDLPYLQTHALTSVFCRRRRRLDWVGDALRQELRARDRSVSPREREARSGSRGAPPRSPEPSARRGKFYFVPNVDRALMARHVAEQVRVMGDITNNVIKAKSIEAKKDGQWRLVFDESFFLNPYKP